MTTLPPPARAPGRILLAHLAELLANRFQPIGFFYPQFLGVTNNSPSFGLCGKDRQDRDSIDRARNQLTADLKSF